jgi:MORN repeat variant
MRLPLLASIVAIAGTASALPNPDTRFRPGANHHLGDDSFVARFGRLPTDADDEHLRMTAHLELVRAWLASRPPTKPELAARRAELLGFLSDYIARGITPVNAHLPWRTAVFIDDAGAICAVGYLIERSVGRALPEKIAAAHRYDFLEDIAAAMPDVDAWIRSSGFTLDELASIQPAYSSPNTMQWRTWDLANHAPADGPFDSDHVHGRFAHKSMQGLWTVANEKDVVVGRGELVNGSGTWRSYYADGKQLLAQGPYVHNVAHGAWTFFHPNGRVAAEGRFTRGKRTGRWRFYTDTKDKTLLATGEFSAQGAVIGTWLHYDANGKLLARTYPEGRADRTDVVPTADGVTHQIHQWVDWPWGPVETYQQELERLSSGKDQIYVHRSTYRAIKQDEDPAIIYDADGFKLEHTASGWTAADCHWSHRRIAAAHAGELAFLHDMLYTDMASRAVTQHEHHNEVEPVPAPTCATPAPVTAARAAKLDKLIAPREMMRAQSPTFVREMILGTEDGGTPHGDDASQKIAGDLARVLAAYTIGYLEWPHIDGRFDRVFATMAGRLRWEWAGSEPEADGTSPLQNEPHPKLPSPRGFGR